MAAVSPRYAPHLGRWRNQPAAMLGRAEQRREAGARIEARQTEPIDRAIARDERRALAVADQRVVFNVRRHGSRGQVAPSAAFRSSRASGIFDEQLAPG